MPGVNMMHGFMGKVEKCICFLWTVFLIAGPYMETMRFFLNRVRSVTTDFGTELTLTSMPDYLPAFMRRLHGASMDSLAGSVKICTKLLPMAIEIAGTSHVVAGALKQCFTRLAFWPAYLQKLWAMCTVFRI